MVAAQTSAIVYGVYLWVQDSEAAHERQLDSAALDAMDRAGAYYTARAPELRERFDNGAMRVAHVAYD